MSSPSCDLTLAQYGLKCRHNVPPKNVLLENISIVTFYSSST